jgi:hypothetical protein
MMLLNDIGGAIGRWTRGMRARAQLRRELTALEENGELDAVLADAGLTRAQVGTLIDANPESAELLMAMLERLRIASTTIPLATMREMGWTCATCTDKRRCREWLAKGEETEFRAFCPNAALIDYELLRSRQSRT